MELRRLKTKAFGAMAAPSANFFQKFLSPILTESGATGSGKTYMACAFGMEACKQRYKTKYVRLPDLLLERMGYLIVHVHQHACRVEEVMALPLGEHNQLP